MHQSLPPAHGEFCYSFSISKAFPPLGNSDHVVSISIDFLSNSKRDAPFHRIAFDFLVLIGMVFVII